MLSCRARCGVRGDRGALGKRSYRYLLGAVLQDDTLFAGSLARQHQLLQHLRAVLGQAAIARLHMTELPRLITRNGCSTAARIEALARSIFVVSSLSL